MSHKVRINIFLSCVLIVATEGTVGSSKTRTYKNCVIENAMMQKCKERLKIKNMSYKRSKSKGKLMSGHRSCPTNLFTSFLDHKSQLTDFINLFGTCSFHLPKTDACSATQNFCVLLHLLLFQFPDDNRGGATRHSCCLRFFRVSVSFLEIAS